VNIGILGGSFNPPHCGHINLSHIAKKNLQLNQIWWFPARINPLKNTNYIYSYERRLKLCNSITSKYPFIKVFCYNYIYALNLVMYLNNRYPNYKFTWLMGDDIVSNIHNWHQYQRFLLNIRIAIFSRSNKINYLKKYPCWNFLKNNDHVIIRNKKFVMSSTQIRNNV
jgi:nicotinate-nucleotide adenylyltransferase